MHIPYSMDDSEPDLVAPWGQYNDHQDLASSYGDPADRIPTRTPMFVFHSELELAQSEVFHRLLLRSLKCKERQIDELRQEILNLMESE